VQLIGWVLRSLQAVDAASTDAGLPATEDAADPYREWGSASPDVFAQTVAVDGDAYPLLHSLLRHTAQLIQQLPAHSSRNETIAWLYNAVVWYLKPHRLLAAYLRHLLLPRLLQTPVCGIPGVSHMTLHYDGERREHYVSTEGSNFTALFMLNNGLAVDRRRCLTTNILEIHAVLPLFCVSRTPP
jgi:hypothetical protein